uniref:Nodulin-like domain-containing protein n=1 Tax=Fagus sylvatica TaxID=28930 RepID=A0A2N9IJP6_FAGSY
MLALLPTFVSLMLMLLVRIYKANTSDDKKHLNGFSAIALIIAGYLMIMIILENIFSLPSWARNFTFILLLILLASPLGIAIKAQKEDSKRFLKTFNLESNDAAKDQAYHELPSGEGEVNAALDEKNLSDEEGMNLLQAVCTVNFWLLFIAMICGMGSTQAVINNLSQIGQSLNYTTVEMNNLVSLWSIWTCLGRVGSGYLSDYLLHTRGWTRPLLMAITLATVIIGHIVIASGFPGNLYVGSILMGICDGSQWSLMPTITSDIFGVRHMGTIYNTFGLGCPIGSYIFSVRVIGYIYDMEAGGEDHSCLGQRSADMRISTSPRDIGTQYPTSTYTTIDGKTLPLAYGFSIAVWLIHLRHLLLSSEIKPRLRPINARNLGCFQEHWHMRRGPGWCHLLRANITLRNYSGFCGPWVVQLAGAIQNFLGYFLTWACVVGLIATGSGAVDVSLSCSNVHSFYDVSLTQLIPVTGVHNFPVDGCLGISGAIVIQVYDTFYKGDPSKFLLMLALLPTFVPLMLMLLVKIYKANIGDDKKHLNGFSAIVLIIAGYLMLIIMLENIFSLPSWARIFTFILLLILLASPLGLAIKAQKEDSKRFLKTFNLESNDAKDQAYHELPSGEGEVNAPLDEKKLSDEEGMNLLQAMCTVNFWLVVYCHDMWNGVVVYCHDMWNGLDTDCDKQLEPNGTISQLHFCGDYLLHTRGWTRPLLMSITLAATIIGHIVIASGFPGTLYVGSILMAICDGSFWTLMPTIALDMFGVRHMGTIFNAIGVACPVGSYIFSVRIIGYIYDKEAGGEDHSCFGTREGALGAGLELGQVAVVISGGGGGDESGVEELEDSISNVGKIGLDLGRWIYLDVGGSSGYAALGVGDGARIVFVTRWIQ